jgi:hypothetical protein
MKSALTESILASELKHIGLRMFGLQMFGLRMSQGRPVSPGEVGGQKSALDSESLRPAELTS